MARADPHAVGAAEAVEAPAGGGPGGTVVGPDGRPRCPWARAAPDCLAYHDGEWGRPLRGDDALFERLCLEAFQSGLSWLVILRKREALRRAFHHFSISRVAAFGPDDIARLVADPTIVRNRAKIEATVANARAAAELGGSLSDLLWSFAPDPRPPRPERPDAVRTRSPESVAMAHALRRRGFRFVGPTTSYALMQATGMVDDHLAGCWVPPYHAAGW